MDTCAQSRVPTVGKRCGTPAKASAQHTLTGWQVPVDDRKPSFWQYSGTGPSWQHEVIDLQISPCREHLR